MISVKADWEGRPLEELSRLIELRAEQLGEAADVALYATARHVLRSLKPQMKVAKLSKAERGFDLEDTGWVIGKHDGRFVPHTRFRADYKTEIRPIIMWGGGQPVHTVHVYRVTPKFGKRMTWKRNAHQGSWYIASYSKDVAERHARRLMDRAVRKYSGLARASVVAMQMAARTVRQTFSPQFQDELSYGDAPQTVVEAADRMASASFRKAGREAHLTVEDRLDYARDALKGGEAAITIALMKAANSTAGYLRNKSGDLLDRRLATPFPELSKKR